MGVFLLLLVILALVAFIVDTVRTRSFVSLGLAILTFVALVWIAVGHAPSLS